MCGSFFFFGGGGGGGGVFFFFNFFFLFLYYFLGGKKKVPPPPPPPPEREGGGVAKYIQRANFIWGVGGGSMLLCSHPHSPFPPALHPTKILKFFSNDSVGKLQCAQYSFNTFVGFIESRTSAFLSHRRHKISVYFSISVVLNLTRQ